MVSKKDNIYVIIVTYNGLHWLDKCLGSLKNSNIPINTVVIDNLSTDKTVDFIQKNYPEIILFQEDENLGFGKANNIGIKYALKNNADYIYLLNQDAWIEEDTIDGLIGLMKKYPEYGIISPLQYTGNEEKLDAGFQLLLSENYHQDSLNKFNQEIYSLDFIMAAHWLISAKAIKETGLFLPLFKHYGEDKNLANRMIYHNWKVGFSPLYKGYHDRENRKDSEEQKLKIEYARYLAFCTNINFSEISQVKYFLLFTKRLIRSKVPFSKKINYFGQAIESLFPIAKYRKQTKNKYFQ